MTITSAQALAVNGRWRVRFGESLKHSLGKVKRGVFSVIFHAFQVNSEDLADLESGSRGVEIPDFPARPGGRNSRSSRAAISRNPAGGRFWHFARY